MATTIICSICRSARVNLFDSGAGSRARPVFKTGYTKFAEACSGFTAVTLQADNLKVRLIDYRGKLLYTANIPRTVA